MGDRSRTIVQVAQAAADRLGNTERNVERFHRSPPGHTERLLASLLRELPQELFHEKGITLRSPLDGSDGGGRRRTAERRLDHPGDLRPVQGREVEASD